MEIVTLITGFGIAFGIGFTIAFYRQNKKLSEQTIDFKLQLDSQQNNFDSAIEEKTESLRKLETDQVEQVAKSVQTISDVLDESADSSDQTSSALTEVTAQIQTLTEMVAMIIDLSNSASGIADKGKQNISSVVADLSELAKSNADLAMLLEKFNQVQEKTVAIRYIGEEAEMLALNAAIEAARAGDAGRGFAVVADSMKSLAMNSQNTTHEILEIVQESDKIISQVARSFSERGEKLDSSINDLVKKFTHINISVNTIQSHAEIISHDSDGISSLMKKSASTTKTSVESLVKHLSEVVSTITGKKVVDLSPNEVLEQWKQFDEIIDVRRAEELTGELGSIKGVRLSTLQTKFKQDVNTLDKSKRYLFICRSGGRSTKAAQMAIAKGVEQVFNLDGGMLAWRKQDL